MYKIGIFIGHLEKFRGQGARVEKPRRGRQDGRGVVDVEHISLHGCQQYIFRCRRHQPRVAGVLDHWKGIYKSRQNLVKDEGRKGKEEETEGTRPDTAPPIGRQSV